MCLISVCVCFVEQQNSVSWRLSEPPAEEFAAIQSSTQSFTLEHIDRGVSVSVECERAIRDQSVLLLSEAPAANTSIGGCTPPWMVSSSNRQLGF
jgi:hypothetical protein